VGGEEGYVRLEGVNDGVLDALAEEFGAGLRWASLVLAGATSAGVARFLDAGGVGLRRLTLTPDAELDLSAVDWARATPALAELELARTRLGPSVLGARSLERLELKQCVVASAETELDLDAKLPHLKRIDLVDTAIGVRRLVAGEASPIEWLDASHKLPGPWFEELVFVSCRKLHHCKVRTSKAPWRARFSGDFPTLTTIKFAGPRGRHAVDVTDVREGAWLVKEASRRPGASAGDPIHELSQLGYAVTKTEQGRYRIGPQLDESGWKKKWASDLPGAARLERLGDVEALSVGLRLRDSELRKLLDFAGADRLRSFEVDSPRFRDAGPLAACTGLEELTLSDAALEDPSPLAALPKLAALTLRSCKNLDLTSLPRFPALRWLNLTYSEVVDHAPLLDCARLEKLEIGLPDYHDAPEVFETLRRRGVDVDPSQEAATAYRDREQLQEQAEREAKKSRRAKE